MMFMLSIAASTPRCILLFVQMRGHPNVVGMLGVCDTAVVTEYYSTNFLGILFRNKRPLPIGQIISMALDAARGLQVGASRISFRLFLRGKRAVNMI